MTIELYKSGVKYKLSVAKYRKLYVNDIFSYICIPFTERLHASYIVMNSGNGYSKRNPMPVAAIRANYIFDQNTF